MYIVLWGMTDKATKDLWFNSRDLKRVYLTDRGSTVFQVLAATQTPGSEGKRWFQGTADAVRQFDWLFDVRVRFDAFFFMDGTNMPIWCQCSIKYPKQL